MVRGLTGLKQYGYLFLLWSRRDLVSRYAGSAAGLLWAVIQPLATVAVFYLVFAVVLRVRVPELASESGYFLYLLAGLLPWLAIVDGLTRASTALTGQEQFLSRTVFPVGLLPVSAIITSLVPQLVGGVVLLAMLAHGGLLSPSKLLLFGPPLFACQLLLTVGLGCALSMLSVHLRDTTQALPVIMQVFFYATPILYPRTMIPEEHRHWLLLNPFAPLIDAYHWLLLDLPLDAVTLAALGGWTLLLGAGGWLLFQALKPTLGDYL